MSFLSQPLYAKNKRGLDGSDLEIGRVGISEVLDELVSEKCFHGLNLKIT